MRQASRPYRLTRAKPAITARPVPGRNEITMTDDELGRQVTAELSWDPQVDS